MSLLSFLVTLVPFLCLSNIFGPSAALECIRDDCIRTRSRMFPTWIEYKENTRSFFPIDESYEGNVVSFRYFGLTQISEQTLVTNHSEHIIALNISGSEIASIEERAFTSLSCLDTLDLSQNHLSYFQNDTFIGLKRLTVLNISYNDLEFIVENNFLYMENLEVLDISHNRIEVVGVETFSDLVQLKTLLLNDNRIRKLIHYKVFNNLFALRTLNLESNWLAIVASYMFSELHSLESLNLANNGLQKFVFQGFGNKELAHVTNLNLSSNGLTELDARDVKNIFSNDRLVLDINANHFYCPTMDLILSNLESRGITLAPGRSNETENKVRNYTCAPTKSTQNDTYELDEELTKKQYEDEDEDLDKFFGTTSTMSALDALIPEYLDEMTYNHHVEVVLIVLACILLLSGILITVDYVLNYDYLRRALCCTRQPVSPDDSPGHEAPIGHIQLESNA
ncbi:uncharacterized protein LOC143191058 isoform X1 [Rhynchophorus ferrugineus]|uniref:Uncharacterized protein n=1 Tax=Rhynchophorus ferrugineus TaxID=354439 RepID=A0A834IVX7_RHYFE|nr:hypothetical protein GWI33_007382 [Rhynchophorus ferrugineus]